MKHLARAIVLGMLGVGIVGVSVTQAGDARSRTDLEVPQGAAITAAAVQTSGRPGGTFQVDVYFSNIPDLGAYQVLVKATGGTQGTLTVQDLAINRDRKDYVFGQDEIIDVLNKQQTILAAVKSTGGATVGKPMYAGTFTFVASADAKGVFSIVIEKGPAASLMTNSVAQEFSFEIGKTATITIGAVLKRPTSDR